MHNAHDSRLRNRARPGSIAAPYLAIDNRGSNRLSGPRQFFTGKEHVATTMLGRLQDEAAYWGKMTGTRFGEPFNCREPIAVTDFTRWV